MVNALPHFVYGPVSSWRLGASLGVDLLSREEKICSFDCLYCQLGQTDVHTTERKVYVPTEALLEEISALPPELQIDFITFSGRGEPTLAANLGTAIEAVKKVRREPVAILTNASLVDRKEVRAEMARADLVVAKLDACSDELLRLINRPAAGIVFDEILDGLHDMLAGGLRPSGSPFTSPSAARSIVARAGWFRHPSR